MNSKPMTREEAQRIAAQQNAVQRARAKRASLWVEGGHYAPMRNR